MEQRDADRFSYRRPHSWVALFKNITNSVNPENESGGGVMDATTVEFIEPSTGRACSSSCMEYILIDSVWNQYQYYVNKQKYVRIGEIRWDLKNTKDWEHLFPGEHTIENDSDIMKEKHLNTIPSWVEKLQIGEKEFEERFPHRQKTVLYKRVKHQRFSSYFNRDGKVMQVTLFADDDYTRPLIDLSFFENRADMLRQVKKDYKKSEIEEVFGKGRKDSLKRKYINSVRNSG